MPRSLDTRIYSPATHHGRVQLSSNELAIERRLLAPGQDTAAKGGAAPAAAAAVTGGRAAAATAQVLVMSLTTTMAIKGVDATAKHVLVWSGKLCEVYQIPDAPLPAAAPAPKPASDGGAMRVWVMCRGVRLTLSCLRVLALLQRRGALKSQWLCPLGPHCASWRPSKPPPLKWRYTATPSSRSRTQVRACPGHGSSSCLRSPRPAGTRAHP